MGGLVAADESCWPKRAGFIRDVDCKDGDVGNTGVSFSNVKGRYSCISKRVRKSCHTTAASTAFSSCMYNKGVKKYNR